MSRNSFQLMRIHPLFLKKGQKITEVTENSGGHSGPPEPLLPHTVLAGRNSSAGLGGSRKREVAHGQPRETTGKNRMKTECQHDKMKDNVTRAICIQVALDWGSEPCAQPALQTSL